MSSYMKSLLGIVVQFVAFLEQKTK